MPPEGRSLDCDNRAAIIPRARGSPSGTVVAINALPFMQAAVGPRGGFRIEWQADRVIRRSARPLPDTVLP